MHFGKCAVLGALFLVVSCGAGGKVGFRQNATTSAALEPAHRNNLVAVGTHVAGLDGGQQPSAAEQAVINSFSNAPLSLSPQLAAKSVAEAVENGSSESTITENEQAYIATLTAPNVGSPGPSDQVTMGNREREHICNSSAGAIGRMMWKLQGWDVDCDE